MKTKDRRTRIFDTGTSQQLSFGTLEAAAAVGSFQAALADCELAEVSGGRESLPAPMVSRRVELSGWRLRLSEVVKRGWSFLQVRYKTSTTKRLRVSETISLGEKRFVAIVAVEGREFLIGGGVSGMSLLAQLGSTGAVAGDLVQKFGDGGGVL
jgi:hypothetical protein